MGKENIDGQVEMYTKDNIKMISEVDLEQWSGLTGQCMRVSGLKEFKMDKVKWNTKMEQ